MLPYALRGKMKANPMMLPCAIVMPKMCQLKNALRLSRVCHASCMRVMMFPRPPKCTR